MKKRVTNGEIGEKFKFEQEGDALEGYYMGSRTIEINGDDVLAHSIKTDDGLVSTLGSHNLNEGLNGLATGTRVRITFTGVKKLKKGKTLKLFDVEFDDEDVLSAA